MWEIYTYGDKPYANVEEIDLKDNIRTNRLGVFENNVRHCLIKTSNTGKRFVRDTRFNDELLEHRL